MLTVELNANLNGETFLKSVQLPCLPNKNDKFNEGKIEFFVHRNEFLVSPGIDGSDVIIGTKLDVMLIDETIENAKEYLKNRGWHGQGCLL